MLLHLSAFFEEHDIEPDKSITILIFTIMIFVKEHLHMLADEISSYLSNLSDTSFALERRSCTVKFEDAPETTQEKFI